MGLCKSRQPASACRTDARSESLRLEGKLPFGWGGIASGGVLFAYHFHEFSGLWLRDGDSIAGLLTKHLSGARLGSRDLLLDCAVETASKRCVED